MADYSRTQRVGDQLQKELAMLIQQEIKDPRIGMVTVSAVEISRDLAYAEVYITCLGVDDKSRQEEIEKILNGAAGFLRSRLARLMKLRIVPHLRFHYDESIARGQHLSALIEKAVGEDHSRGHDDEDR
jgi:ribosome-binding factor A